MVEYKYVQLELHVHILILCCTAHCAFFLLKCCPTSKSARTAAAAPSSLKLEYPRIHTLALPCTQIISYTDCRASVINYVAFFSSSLLCVFFVFVLYSSTYVHKYIFYLFLSFLVVGTRCALRSYQNRSPPERSTSSLRFRVHFDSFLLLTGDVVALQYGV